MRITRLETALSSLSTATDQPFWGHVSAVKGDVTHITGLSGVAHLGDRVTIENGHGHQIGGEVISMDETSAIAILYDEASAIRVGAKASFGRQVGPKPSPFWTGHILNPFGLTADGAAPPPGPLEMPLKAPPPPAPRRKTLGPRLNTGLCALDTFLPLCRGQRLGLFAGSGVGKSVMLSELARNMEADIVVLALIGERGREVRAFAEDALGPEGLKRSVVFAATSSDPAPLKKRAAYMAMATAEYFRDQGKHVLLLFDSLTRFAESHREVALSAGETPSLRAFPPSTFRAVAGLCERAGPGLDGSGDITAVFSVLVAGSNMEEPVADMVRGILDGHVVLDRQIAERGRYPAIDVRRSVSRSLPHAASAAENGVLSRGRALLGAYEEAAPMIRAGLYAPGTDPLLDEAVKIWPQLDRFIGETSPGSSQESYERLMQILAMQPEAAADQGAQA